MSWIKEKLFDIFLKGRIQNMLTKLWGAIDGYKTYILAILGIVVALAGHFWGPIHIGDQTIPQMGWGEVWTIVWNSGLFAALRHGADKPAA